MQEGFQGRGLGTKLAPTNPDDSETVHIRPVNDLSPCFEIRRDYPILNLVITEGRLQIANRFDFLVATHAPDDAESLKDILNITNRDKSHACQGL